MLIHHADAELVRLVGAGDFAGVTADHDVAFLRAVESHDALDQRAFAGTVFTQQGVERARRDFQ